MQTVVLGVGSKLRPQAAAKMNGHWCVVRGPRMAKRGPHAQTTCNYPLAAKKEHEMAKNDPFSVVFDARDTSEPPSRALNKVKKRTRPTTSLLPRIPGFWADFLGPRRVCGSD
jgi:hypothetical protein